MITRCKIYLLNHVLKNDRCNIYLHNHVLKNDRCKKYFQNSDTGMSFVYFTGKNTNRENRLIFSQIGESIYKSCFEML